MRAVPTSLLALGLTVVLGGTALGARVDQSQTDASVGVTVLGGDAIGQVFTAGRTGYLDAVRLWPQSDLTGRIVEVRGVEGGVPVDPVLASQAWTSSATSGSVKVRFDDPAIVRAGHQYAVTVSYPTMRGAGTDVYPGGVLAYHAGSWSTTSSVDLAFETYVQKAVGTLHWVGVRKAPSWNAARAGATIKVRFTLGGDWGTKVIRGGWPKVRRVSCTSRKPIAGTEWQTRPFGGSLAYSDSTERYTLTWRVPAAWGSGAMRCRELRLRLIDGSTHSLFFRFRPAA